MTSVYSKDLEVYAAEQFIRSIRSSNVYITFGHQTPWTNDTNPDQANTSVASYYDTWKNMIGGKLISGSDLRHVIPRINWTTGTTYIAYNEYQDSSTKNANTAYYVMTDDFNVYKCVANNNGTPSTYKPSSTNPGIIFQTGDQYTWKYMYTLTGEEQLRFTTSKYIPVKTLTQNDNSLQWQVEQDAVAGAIDSIVLTNFGTDYLYANAISVTITGDGRFANAFALVNTQSQTISSIVVDNFGSGYTFANVSISSTVGFGATAKAVISPPGGHGSDALYELGGSYVMLDVTLNGSEGGILDTQAPYRQISILHNPLVYGTTTISSNQEFSQLTTIALSQSTSTIDYIVGETVFQGNTINNSTFSGSVAAWDSANSLIKINNVLGNPTSALLSGQTSAAQRYVTSVANPDLKPYTGHILYKDNIPPIQRAEDQNENFKIVLSF